MSKKLTMEDTVKLNEKIKSNFSSEQLSPDYLKTLMDYANTPEPVVVANSPSDSSRIFGIIKDCIFNFQKTLSDNESIGMLCQNTNMPMIINNIDYYLPSVIVFKGTIINNGKNDYCELIQHTNQLNLCLVKIRPETPIEKREIGFRVLSPEQV